MFITSPEKFAAWFNMKFPSAYRQITTQDIQDMNECKLIYRYGYFSLEKDPETVRGILQYEQLVKARKQMPPLEKMDEIRPPRCKMCGELLPQQSEGKKGRPREYRSGCESFNSPDRKFFAFLRPIFVYLTYVFACQK